MLIAAVLYICIQAILRNNIHTSQGTLQLHYCHIRADLS